MKVTYTADDGTEFDSADKCLAYEEDSSELCEIWTYRLRKGQHDCYRELWQLLISVQTRKVELQALEHWWVYRRRFVELAKTFIEADPTLNQLNG